jgi:hypothetical protein
MLQRYFPNLDENNYKATSPGDNGYNCIAWAYGVNDNWFWPDDYYFWPEDIKREETVEAFIELFRSINYERCDTASLETDREKVAIYALCGIPTHAARQLPNGKWTSKLGEEIDIEHDNLACLNGPVYGEVEIIMSRARRS